MKVAMICGLLLCVLIIALGVLLLWTPLSVVEKCVLVPFYTLSGLAFFAMGIDLLMEDM